jgi:hypothetical protein
VRTGGAFVVLDWLEPHQTERKKAFDRMGEAGGSALAIAIDAGVGPGPGGAWTPRSTRTTRTMPDLEALVASWPHADARAALRIGHLLASNDASGADWWRSKTRERAERELAEDGLAPEKVDAVILTIDDALGPDLDAILADLRRRERDAPTE